MAHLDSPHAVPAALLGDLYESVINPSLLTPTVSALSQWLKVDAAHFIGWDTSRFVPRVAVLNDGSLDQVDPDYVKRYSQIDPRRARMATVPLGQLARCDQFFDERFVARNEFFQDFLLPRGRRYTMGAQLYRDSRFDFYVSFYHSVGRDTFDEQQMRQAQALVPHLQRVARMLVQHDAALVACEWGQSALDTLDQGVLVLDETGDVLSANRRAEAILQQGRWLVSQQRRLRAAAGLQADLPTLLQRVLSTGVPESTVLRHPPGRGDTDPWCAVTVSRPGAGHDQSMRAIHPRAALLVYLTVPEAQRHATALQLMQMFGLTQAEARLAHALVQGSTVDEYAEAQGLAMPTVRSQVRAVLDKTRTARQQDLVRLLSAIPSARAPRPVAMPALRSG
jgi:DNA-binding CsgD family transcriptional regulator/PAS domain-containing protein